MTARTSSTVRRSPAGAVCACLAAAALLRAQAPPAGSQPPAFKSSSELVQVDAIVHDGEGRFVGGLRAEDLELREDGKPQAIQQFYLVTHDLAGIVQPFADRPPPAEYHAQRVFIVMFDEGHLADDSLIRVKVGAERFVREWMTEGDVGGVFVNGRMHNGRLTTDRGELVAAVHAVRPGFETRQSLLLPFREWPRVPSEHDAVRISDGAREVTDALGALACREDPFECQERGGLQQVENLIQQKAKLYVRQARTLTGRTIQNLQTVARGLARIPGRKTVVLLSEGFFVEESRSILEKIAAQAARAGATIYSIDGRGLVNTMGATTDATRASRARSTAFDAGEDAPLILTANTGGFMLRGIDDISRAFGMIVRDTSTYYVIGYQPANSTMDGKFRKIEVRARIKGVTVRARKGYVADPLPPQAAMWGK